MDITGILKVKYDEQKVSDKFRKRELVITDNSSQYPQHILFQLTQDRCSLIDQYQIGDEIKVHFNLRGRLWNDPKTNTDKYFNSLEAWRLEGKASGSKGSSSTANSSSNEDKFEQFNGGPNSNPSDDLPF